MGKWILKLSLIAACLFTGIFTGVHGKAAADSEAALTAKQLTELVVITGKTAFGDPDKVPLMVVDADGQAIYFQDVPGGGSSFTIQFQPPDTTGKGTATATLYSREPVQSSFPIKKVKDEQVMEVSFRIVGYQGEEILPKITMKAGSETSVFRLLQNAAGEHDISYEIKDADEDGHDIYVTSIDGLGEFDKGPGSGWVYRVNGKVPQAPIDRYLVEQGDEIELLYTSDFGESEGGEPANGKRISYTPSESVSVESAMGRLQYAEDADGIVGIVHDLLFDLASYELDKQQKFVPDVALFLQAACERAALLDTNEEGSGSSTQIELSSGKTRDFLEEQAKVLTGLEEELADSTLYKPLLQNLQRAVVISLPEKTEKTDWNLLIDEDAWKRIIAAKAKVGVVRGDWRSDIVPAKQEYTGGSPLRFQFRFYTDREQTEQWQQLAEQGNSAMVPLSSSYRIVSDKPGEAKFLVTAPLTGSLQEGSWPVLYLRKDEKSAWAPATEWVELSSTKAAVPFFPGGDLVIASVAPSFFDVQEASPAYSWVKEPIAALAGVGVIKGISPTQFGLDRTITRTEFVTLLERINGEAFQIQLPSRPDGSKLVPNEPISRMEMGYLLAQNAQDWATTGENSLSWKDAANIPEWVRTAISQVTSHGWLRGRTDGRFDPQAKMTRAEAVTVLYRYWKDKHNREKE